MTSYGRETLREGPETPTEWKSESVSQKSHRAFENSNALQNKLMKDTTVTNVPYKQMESILGN